MGTTKKPTDGTPYLQSQITVNIESTSEVERDQLKDLLNEVGSHLVSIGLTASTSNTSVDMCTDGCVGLQSVFDSMFDGRACVVLIDRDIVQPSAVRRCIGMYAENCGDTTKVYTVPDLSSTLSPILSRKVVDGIAFFTSSHLTIRIQNILKPITIETPSVPVPAVICRSAGKKNKKLFK